MFSQKKLSCLVAQQYRQTGCQNTEFTQKRTRDLRRKSMIQIPYLPRRTKAPDLGVRILCHLPSMADLGVLRTPTLLLSAPQFPASYLTWDFSIPGPLENLITNRLLSPCNACAYCGLWYMQGKSPPWPCRLTPSMTLMTLVTLSVLLPPPFKWYHGLMRTFITNKLYVILEEDLRSPKCHAVIGLRPAKLTHTSRYLRAIWILRI